MPATRPTRFPNGIATRPRESALGGAPFGDPTLYHTFFEDFDYFTAASWTITETQAGATQALIDGDGGWLALVNSAADDDLNSVQKTFEGFRWAAGRALLLKTRFKVSDATQSDVAIGLSITDTSPIASVPSDAFYFLKADGAATAIFKAGKDSSYSNSSAFATLSNDTFITLAAWSDGKTKLVSGLTYYTFQLYAGTGNDPTYITSLDVLSTNMCNDEDLTVTLALQNGDANARTLTIDYFLAALQR